MKKLFLWISTIMFCCSLATAGAFDSSDELLLYEECPIGNSIYGQIPAPFYDQNEAGFWTSDIGGLYPGRVHFDNFSGLTEDICRVTWWGVDLYYLNGWQECTEDPMDFEIAFFPDDGSGKPDTFNPIYTLPSVTPTRTPTGQLYGPYGDGIWTELNRYDVELDPCISIAEAWISIKGISSNGDPQDCTFGWIRSAEGDDILWRLDSGVWTQLPQDLGFCLGGEYIPTYGACCDMSTGDCVYVEYQDCLQGARFEADVQCEDLDPPCLPSVFCEEFAYSFGTFTSYIAGDLADNWQWTGGTAYHADDAVDCDDWLISTSDYTVTAGDMLVWDQMDNWSDYIYYHGVLISSDYVDGGDPTTATWLELFTGPAPDGSWETRSVDLTAFAGETAHIAFHYMGNYADQWWVDNVCILGLGGGPCGDYVVGDWNGSGEFNVADIISAFGRLRGQPNDPDFICECPPGSGNEWPVAMDVNNSCNFNIADVIWAFGKLRGQENELVPCELCPPDPSPLPREGNEPLLVPNLRSKSKAVEKLLAK